MWPGANGNPSTAKLWNAAAEKLLGMKPMPGYDDDDFKLSTTQHPIYFTMPRSMYEEISKKSLAEANFMVEFVDGYFSQDYQQDEHLVCLRSVDKTFSKTDWLSKLAGGQWGKYTATGKK